CRPARLMPVKVKRRLACHFSRHECSSERKPGGKGTFPAPAGSRFVPSAVGGGARDAHVLGLPDGGPRLQAEEARAPSVPRLQHHREAPVLLRGGTPAQPAPCPRNLSEDRADLSSRRRPVPSRRRWTDCRLARRDGAPAAI